MLTGALIAPSWSAEVGDVSSSTQTPSNEFIDESMGDSNINIEVRENFFIMISQIILNLTYWNECLVFQTSHATRACQQLRVQMNVKTSQTRKVWLM